MCMCYCCLSHQVLSDTFVTPWTVVHQAPLSMGFLRRDYWSGLPFPSPWNLPNPGIKPTSPALAGRFFTTERLGSPCLKPIIFLKIANFLVICCGEVKFSVCYIIRAERRILFKCFLNKG